MKLIPGIDFINIVREAFMHTDPKSTKKTDRLTVFFALLGSGRAKAARKMLVKLDPSPQSPSPTVVSYSIFDTCKRGKLIVLFQY